MNKEDWLSFYEAVRQFERSLGMSTGAAQAKLRELCASGTVRSQKEPYLLVARQPQGEGPPVYIEPSEWRQREIDVMTDSDGCKYWVDVSKIDLEYWLNQQLTQSTAGGKQPRIIRQLKEMFPAGVPNRADYPRQPLTAELIKRDPSLAPLDPKTLKTAIEAYNRQQQGNARNTSVSD
jgi:hypothetical protein